ncbi:MAG: GCN5-like N-acetyltransferase [Ramlibacter sp.]|nr:GCN5-like N-acetyltransferase [Ramlibacter sp.]
MILRAATMDDADALLAWRNDPATRALSHDKANVERHAHLEWLARSLANPHRRLLIAERDGVPVGTVRADFINGVHELSWTVAPQARGQGVAKEMVAMLAAQIQGTIRAQVLRGNDASVQVALHAGMKLLQEVGGVIYFER